MTTDTKSKKSAWSTAAVIVAIIAVGILAAGLLDDPESDAIAIPGCAEVVAAEDLERVNYAFGTGDFSWFSDAEAADMSEALADALPTGSAVQSDPNWPSLQFEAMHGTASAWGIVSAAGEQGPLTVDVSRTDQPVGPCFAGYVDERRTLPDGTVVDTFAGTKENRASAHTPDGSLIDAYSQGPLTVDQLVTIVTTPGLRTGGN